MSTPRNLAYRHEDCGSVTEVGGSIVANMHADPYYYIDGMTICANCGEVPDSRCQLVDSGQRLDKYCADLKKTKGTAYHVVRWVILLAFVILGVVVSSIVFPNGPHPIPQPWSGLLGVIIGIFASMFVGKWIRLMLCKAGVI